MRVTLDTNIVVSAALWGGKPRQVLDAGRDGVCELYTTPVLLAELESILGRERFQIQFLLVGFTPKDLIEEFVGFAIVIDAPSIEPTVRDPDDDAVLACAVASESDFIVSGDKDLLDLNEYRGVRILTAREFLTELNL